MNYQMSEEEKKYLEDYDASIYDRPSVTVDTTIFSVLDIETDNYRKLPEKELKILLIKRKEYPYKNLWALPGGFVQMDESLEHAAYRELKEETNVENAYLEQLFTWGEPHRDPRTRVISTSYMALIDGTKCKLKSGTDSEEVRWFSLNCKVIQETKTILMDGFRLEKKAELTLQSQDITIKNTVVITKEVLKDQTTIKREVESSGQLAFDHAKIIYYSLERLRAKVEFTDIAFHLMSPTFTLTELQNVYEVILDTKLLTANFRRKINPYVTETDGITSNAGHRPAKLYRYMKQDHYDFY